jgi:hypothetical protein
MKVFREGYLGNHKLFSELLPDLGSIKVALYSLLNRNFDQNAFYGCAKDKQGNVWKEVGEYNFRVAKVGDQPFLFLWKL